MVSSKTLGDSLTRSDTERSFRLGRLAPLARPAPLARLARLALLARPARLARLARLLRRRFRLGPIPTK